MGSEYFLPSRGYTLQPRPFGVIMQLHLKKVSSESFETQNKICLLKSRNVSQCVCFLVQFTAF